MICDKRFEDAEPHGVVNDALDQPRPFPGRHDRPLERQDSGQDALQPCTLLRSLQAGHLIQVDLLQQTGPILRDKVLAAAGHLALAAHGLRHTVSQRHLSPPGSRRSESR